MKYSIFEKVKEVLTKIYPEKGNIDFSIEVADPKFGDYSTNIAMILGKRVGEKPEEIAKKIVTQLSNDEMFEKVEVIKPGFINFKIALPYLQNKISEIVEAGERYGESDLGKDLKVNVEFISANPTGPLTLGNGRGGYCGDVLANILESFGSKVEREYYVNDRGAQIIALGHSVLKDDKAVYCGGYIEELSSKISSKDPEKAGAEAAAILIEESIQKTISKMGIKFDRWYSESALFKGPVEEIMGILEKEKLTYKLEGALWIKTTEYGDDKDRVLITSDGEYTYFAADLAYHYIKIKRGYTTLVDIWGADHHGYVGRMKAGVEILEKELDSGVDFRILVAQLARLIAKGKEIKMSKRLGTYVTLDELLDEVGPDVTRFFFLQRSLDTHMDFDLDLAKEKSEKNPVYYVQYAYARIASILNKSPNYPADSNHPITSLIKDPVELLLIKELIKLPDIVIGTAEDYQVQRLPFYAIELANKFHNFYEKCRVISEDDKLTAARIELIKATQIVLKKTLDLMGISAPEKM